MSDEEIRDRLIRLETIVGDGERGLLAEITSLKQAVDDLKSFQLRIMGGFGVVAVVAQVAIQLFLR
jgi:hypothetical protein